MASGSDDGSFSIWNLRMLKVCIDSEVKDWWLFFFSPLIKGLGDGGVGLHTLISF